MYKGIKRSIENLKKNSKLVKDYRVGGPEEDPNEFLEKLEKIYKVIEKELVDGENRGRSSRYSKKLSTSLARSRLLGFSSVGKFQFHKFEFDI